MEEYIHHIHCRIHRIHCIYCNHGSLHLQRRGVPECGELSFGSPYLRGIRNEKLGGTVGHGKSSKNNLKTNKHKFFITLSFDKKIVM